MQTPPYLYLGPRPLFPASSGEAPPLADGEDAGARPHSEEYGLVGGFPRRAQSWPLSCHLARSCSRP